MSVQRLLIILTLLNVSTYVSFGQRIAKPDLKVGALTLGASFDSIPASFGRPDSIKTFDQEWSDFTAHYYQKVIVWTKNQDRRIWAIDIYDRSLATYRGLRIGDSLDTIEKLYSKRNWIVPHFTRVGPYDYTFRDYTEATIYENSIQEDEGWFLILFTKKNRLVKMLFYIGVPE
jgi:hypothetical protein